MNWKSLCALRVMVGWVLKIWECLMNHLLLNGGGILFTRKILYEEIYWILSMWGKICGRMLKKNLETKIMKIGLKRG